MRGKLVGQIQKVANKEVSMLNMYVQEGSVVWLFAHGSERKQIE